MAEDETVSDFIVGTCWCDLRPNVNKLKVWHYDTLTPTATLTGSVSELYIEPMLPCVGDVDVMRCDVTHLVVSSREQLPVRLPLQFADCVELLEIVDTEFPVYVYLIHVGLLRRQNDHLVYEPIEFTEGLYLFTYSTDVPLLLDDTQTTGPAKKYTEFNTFKQQVMPGDVVHSLRCLSWPTQAADWPKRPRKQDWPTKSTVEYVVNNGCDLVYVSHHQCSDDDKEMMMRLSFSRAETVLLNSWTFRQQIVYHMLRKVIRIEKLTEARDQSGCRIMSNYHVKTLMLWTCERESSTWWMESNVVTLCKSLIQSLLDCFSTRFCDGYFVTSHNLFECDTLSSEFQHFKDRLIPLTDSKNLTECLRENYIRICLNRCPTVDVRQLENPGPIGRQSFATAMSAVVRWRNDPVEVKTECAQRLIFAMFEILQSVAGFVMRGTPLRIRQLAKVDRRLAHYLTAVYCLELAEQLRVRRKFDDVVTDSVADNLVEFLQVEWNSDPDCTFPFVATETSGSSVQKAAELMQTTLAMKVSTSTDSDVTRSTTEVPDATDSLFAAGDFRRYLESRGVEHLTLVHQAMSRDLSGVTSIVSTDVQALYDYKLGLYEKCYQTSKENVNKLWYKEGMGVDMCYCMTVLLDDVLTSFAGICILEQYVRRQSSSRQKLKPSFQRAVSVSQLTLSLHLSIQCQLKLRRQGSLSTDPTDMISVVRALNDRLSPIYADDHIFLMFLYRKLFAGRCR